MRYRRDAGEIQAGHPKNIRQGRAETEASLSSSRGPESLLALSPGPGACGGLAFFYDTQDIRFCVAIVVPEVCHQRGRFAR